MSFIQFGLNFVHTVITLLGGVFQLFLNQADPHLLLTDLLLLGNQEESRQMETMQRLARQRDETQWDEVHCDPTLSLSWRFKSLIASSLLSNLILRFSQSANSALTAWALATTGGKGWNQEEIDKSGEADKEGTTGLGGNIHALNYMDTETHSNMIQIKLPAKLNQ